MDYFHRNSGCRYGLNSYCKECRSKDAKRRYQDNKDAVKIKNKIYYEKNKEDIIRKNSVYYEEHKDHLLEMNNIRRENKKEEISEQRKRHYQNNRERLLDEKKEYDQKSEVKERRNTRQRERYQNDPEYRLMRIYGARIHHFLIGKNKSLSTRELIGLSNGDWMDYLINSSDDPLVNKDNHGSYWDIDHIILCNFWNLNDELDQRKCFNYRNTRPLEKSKNRGRQKLEGTKLELDTYIYLMSEIN